MKEAGSSDTLAPSSQKSATFKGNLYLRCDVASTDRQDAFYTDNINLATLAPVDFHCRLSSDKTVHV